MTTSESYDPRTWREGIDYARAARIYPPVGSDRASRLALALSSAILLSGALLAYSARSEPPPVAASGD